MLRIFVDFQLFPPPSIFVHITVLSLFRRVECVVRSFKKRFPLIYFLSLAQFTFEKWTKKRILLQQNAIKLYVVRSCVFFTLAFLLWDHPWDGCIFPGYFIIGIGKL